MNRNDIKSIYDREGDSAALDAYVRAIEEHKDNEEVMNALAFLAAGYSHPAALTLLFETGVSPSVTDRFAFTLLHYLGRQPDGTYYLRPEGAVAETTALLLDAKVSALRKDENENMTCYHYAARNGLSEMVETMAKRGVKLNMTDRDGNTGIHIACDYIRLSLSGIKYAKEKIEQSQRHYDETVTRLRARNMTEEQITQYIENNMTTTPQRAQMEYDALQKKIEGYFRVVKAFAAGGVDIDEKNSYGQSALEIAIKSDAKKIAAFLSGTLTDESDDAAIAAGGMTLHQAAEKGDIDAIQAIANTGADLNALKDAPKYEFGGYTPLSIVCSLMDYKTAEALLACGSDPAFRDSDGRTAVAYFFLGETNAFSRVDKIRERDAAKIIRMFISAGFDINQTVDDNSNTLLILACAAHGSWPKDEVIHAVLQQNPDINLSNRFGATALMYACADDFDIMENIQIMLLEQGADVNAADCNGDTALHYAARNRDKNGAKTLCDMLLAFDAEAGTVNNAGETALDIAGKEDNEPLVKLLLNKM